MSSSSSIEAQSTNAKTESNKETVENHPFERNSEEIDQTMQLRLSHQNPVVPGIEKEGHPIPQKDPSSFLSSGQEPLTAFTATLNSPRSQPTPSYQTTFRQVIPGSLPALQIDPNQVGLARSPIPSVPFVPNRSFQPGLIPLSSTFGQLPNSYGHASLSLGFQQQQTSGFDYSQQFLAQQHQQALSSQMTFLQTPNMFNGIPVSYSLGPAPSYMALPHFQTMVQQAPPSSYQNNSESIRGLTVGLAPEQSAAAPADAGDDDGDDLSTPKQKVRPKKPLSAYNYFFAEERKKLLTEAKDSSPESNERVGTKRGAPSRSASHGGKKAKSQRSVGFEEMGKIVGKRWRALSPEGKSRYVEKAQTDKDRYELEMERFKAYLQNDLTQMRARQEATVDEETMKAYLQSGGDSTSVKKIGKKQSRNQGSSDA